MEEDRLGKVEQRLDRLEQFVADAFVRSESRMERLERNMERLEGNMQRLEGNMERLEANLQRLQRDVARYVRIGARQILSLREAQARTEARLDRLVETVDKLSLRLEEVADKLDGLIGYVNGLSRPGGQPPSEPRNPA